MESDLRLDVKDLTENTTELFKIVFKRLDDVEKIVKPIINPKRKKISLKD
jgi:hypothetical protein